MTYAGNRRIIDVDSHVVEHPTFMTEVATIEELPYIPKTLKGLPIKFEDARLEAGLAAFEKRKTDPTYVKECEENIMDVLLPVWGRIGSFDPKERVQALEVFGYEQQLILPTFCFHQVAYNPDPKALEVSARVLNRALGQFSKEDSRLKAVGYIPLSLGPDMALALMKEAHEDGCYTFMVDTNQPDIKAKSFSHPDYDHVWAWFETNNAPVVVHIAANGKYKPVTESFMNNDRKFHEVGGDAPPGELGIMTMASSVQLFLSAMIFDGVFDRFPKLRAISMEHGSAWLPGWLKQLDFAANVFKRSREFVEMPSLTARRCIKVSAFPGEDVGWIIDQVGPEMLVYASDYPHIEGSADPIGKFEATMKNCDQATMDKFYYGNMAKIMKLPA